MLVVSDATPARPLQSPRENPPITGFEIDVDSSHVTASLASVSAKVACSHRIDIRQPMPLALTRDAKTTSEASWTSFTVASNQRGEPGGAHCIVEGVHLRLNLSVEACKGRFELRREPIEHLH